MIYKSGIPNNSGGGSDGITLSHTEALVRLRREKDAFYRTDHESPIPEDQKNRFTGLKYFPPSEKYRFELKLHPHQKPEIVTMITSKGTQQKFFKHGYFEFELERKKVNLQAYRSAEREDESLFIPFRDRTSGRESYGAARYLDLEMRSDDDYELDFNLAYNPYCAYSDDYVCPFPPKENWLDVEIRAGEMKYHD